MADKYSVIYDPAEKEPFAIIRASAVGQIAYPLHKSANGWATEYNGGDKKVPYGMTASEFVEMSCDFVESFKTAFSKGDRLDRRVQMLSSDGLKNEPAGIVYGVGPQRTIRRQNGFTRKVMPVVQHLQKDVLRSRIINQAIRTGRRWTKRNPA